MNKEMLMLGMLVVPSVAPAGYPVEETRGRVTVVHMVPDAGEGDEAYVQKVLMKAPMHAGTAHVFLRPGGDEAAWGGTFDAPKGLAFFATPEDFTVSKLDSTVPSLVLLDREGRPGVSVVAKDGGGFASLVDWEGLLAKMAVASDVSHANVKDGGSAVAGYDVTTYFDGEPVKGRASIAAEYRGVTYFFASEAGRLKFDVDPDRYVPAYGGWCAWAMVDGDTVDVDPETFKVVDGRVLLYYNGFLGNTLKKWNRGNEEDLKQKADSNWEAISGRKAE